MSRIRTLKPEWVSDEALNRAGLAARVLSAGLILMADDYGRGPGAIAKIVGEVFAFDMERDPATTLTMAREAMQALTDIGFVRTYRVRGQSYFEILNWDKHQRVEKPGKPRVPEPSEADETHPETLRRLSGDSPESLPPDLDHDHDHDPDRDHDRDPPQGASASNRKLQERALQIVDAAWEKHRGVALGVEMAPGPAVLRRAKSVVRWALEHDPGDWEGAAQRAAEAAAQNIGDSARSAFAVFAASPGQWLTAKRVKGPAPPRRNDEFEHDDPEEFWAKVAAEEAAEREAKHAVGK